MKLSTSEWRLVRRLDETRRRRLARRLGTALVWLATLLLLGLCASEGVRVARRVQAAGLTLEEVIAPRFEGLSEAQAQEKHAVVVSVILRSALMVLYFVLAAFLASLALGMRLYRQQDVLAGKLVQRLRELGELDGETPGPDAKGD